MPHNKCGAKNTCTDARDDDAFGYTCTCTDNRIASSASSAPNCDACAEGYERNGDDCVEITTTTTTTTTSPTTTTTSAPNESTTTAEPLTEEECICAEEGSPVLCDLAGCDWLLYTGGAAGAAVLVIVGVGVAVATGDDSAADALDVGAASGSTALLSGAKANNKGFQQEKQYYKNTSSFAYTRPNIRGGTLKVPKGWH
jgi:hypothetical protein